MGLLDNKTAIVTGSSRGIGAEVAKILAGEGAAVVVNYRQKAPGPTRSWLESRRPAAVPWPWAPT